MENLPSRETRELKGYSRVKKFQNEEPQEGINYIVDTTTRGSEYLRVKVGSPKFAKCAKSGNWRVKKKFMRQKNEDPRR